MASARKSYSRSRPQHIAAPDTERFTKACFINDLLEGVIRATSVSEVRDGNGRLIRLEYDDPQGAAPGAGVTRTRENERE